MPKPYSRYNLAQLIASDHDTASAARILGVPLEYAIKEQQTDEYLRYLSEFRRANRRRNRRSTVSPPTSEPIYSSVFEGTFRFVASGDLDATDSEFALSAINDRKYLNFGLLTADDRRLFESIIAGGRVGFFRSDNEVANARIESDYDATDGIEISSALAVLSVGSDYEIKWSQARPGAPGLNADGSVAGEGNIWFFADYESEGIGVRASFPFGYTIADRIYADFLPVFYPGVNAFSEQRALSVDDMAYPSDVRFTPAFPSQLRGDHVAYLSFTPTIEDDAYIIDILLSETPVDLGLRYQEIDADGNRLIDADGYREIGAR